MLLGNLRLFVKPGQCLADFYNLQRSYEQGRRLRLFIHQRSNIWGWTQIFGVGGKGSVSCTGRVRNSVFEAGFQFFGLTNRSPYNTAD